MRTTVCTPVGKAHAVWRVWARFRVLLLGIVLVMTACSTGAGSSRPPGSEGRTSTSASAVPTSPAVPPLTGMPHVRGAQLVDTTGHPLLLRGAMIPTSLAYIKRWQHGQDPTQILNSATFQAMASWHMNAVRINISYWIYQLNPTSYMAQLDQAVAAAHTAGLYVILDYHDDDQSGNPAPDGMMHTETVTFWKIIAAHYKHDPLMLFDPINEPKYSDWQTWLHGNGSGVVGYQQIITAIRSVGAPQIIILEPGHGCNSCDHASWAGVAPYIPNDPNIMFSLHVYGSVVTGNPQSWDAAWGPVLGHYPIFYGEWAVLPHANYPIFCKGLTSANADAITNAFLTYMQSRNANWTAWDFNPSNLIQSFTDYAPTTFQSGAPWSCEDASAAHAGMGSDVKQFLAAHPA